MNLCLYEQSCIFYCVTLYYKRVDNKLFLLDLLNPLTPGTFCQKMHFLVILVVLRLDLGQISFNLVGNAFATRQLALLATGIAFYDILAWTCAEIKILRREGDVRVKAF